MSIEDEIRAHFRRNSDKKLNSIFTAGSSQKNADFFTNATLRSMMDAIENIKVAFPDGIKPVDIKPAIWQTPIELRMEDLEPPPPAKLQIRDSVPMSNEFRAEMNQWLLDMFGREEKIDYKMRLLGMSLFGPAIKHPGVFAYNIDVM